LIFHQSIEFLHKIAAASHSRNTHQSRIANAPDTHQTRITFAFSEIYGETVGMVSATQVPCGAVLQLWRNQKNGRFTATRKRG
jgi:hypothetical protein